MKNIIYLILLLFYSLTAKPVYFKHIGMKDGLSQLSVMSIYQDKLGRIWFGTLEGVSIYDGEHIRSYKAGDISCQSVINGNKIYPIVGDRKGDILLKMDNSLLKYDLKKDSFISIRSNNITALSSINDNVWVVAKDSLYRWDETSDKLKFVEVFPFKEIVTKVFRDSQGYFWVGTNQNLYRQVAKNTYSKLIANKEIYDIYESSQHDFWIATRLQGMYKITKEGKLYEFLHNPKNSNSISSNQIRAFVEDDSGNLWIGTFTGLNKYNPKTNQFTLYTKTDLLGSLMHPSVFSMLRDKQGSVWVGTYYGGVSYFNPQKDVFTFYSENQNRKDCLNYPFVGQMAEDGDKNVWICTEGGGLNKLNRRTKQFQYFTSRTANPIRHDNVKCITYDSIQNKLYIGTHTGGLSCLDISTGRIQNYLKNSDEMRHNIIIQTAYYKENIIFLDREGLFRLSSTDGTILPLFKDFRQDDLAITFSIDSRGYLWLSTDIGIIKINIENEKDQKFYPKDQKTIGLFNILNIFEASDKNIYFASQGSGLIQFDPQKELFKHYTLENKQITSNYCYYIAESPQGHLIVTGSNGISLLNPQTGVLLKSVSIGESFPISAFNNGCGILVCSNGEIFAGGTNGLISFFEQDLSSTVKEHNLYFCNLLVNNIEILANDASGILKEALPFTRGIKLNYKQNNLNISFANNNYITSYNPHLYEYMLEGFDKEWITTDKTNIIYTNLSPGTYKLKVREKGVLNPKQEITLPITINAAWYATTLARILYVTLALLIIYIFIYFRQRQIQLTTSLLYERKEKERIRELNQAKLSFFTNISHEFRTPLTLIIGQIDALLQDSALTSTLKNKILKMYKHTYKMRNLINELLDFQKFEQKNVALKVQEANLVEFLEEIFLYFEELAASKNIAYNFKADKEIISCWFDLTQLQKVFYNLLSNAFNYTNENGTVEIIVNENESDIEVRVIDTGVGINKDELHKIFEQFYQASNHSALTVKGLSAGIGLALCKNIVNLHHAKIVVESKPNYGSIFIVTLRKGCKHFEEDGITSIINNSNDVCVDSFTVMQQQLIEEEFNEPDSIIEDKNDLKYTILIVEDNEELLELIIPIFKPFYNILVAKNGKVGLLLATEKKPDIVLSDIMMPEMNGLEMCRQIKTNINICHIPVVLLTALTSVEHNIDGLQRGADDYIAKPFNTKLLLTRCNNLIRNRILLQKSFSQQPDFEVSLLANNELDQKILKQVEQIVEDNLSNSEFNINFLAQQLAMSRSSLFTKFKDLTGMTPNDFILNYKLNKAAYMLKNNPELQITDISDQLGFSSARYFSRCFKTQYNIAPMDYRKTNCK